MESERGREREREEKEKECHPNNDWQCKEDYERNIVGKREKERTREREREGEREKKIDSRESKPTIIGVVILITTKEKIA